MGIFFFVRTMKVDKPSSSANVFSEGTERNEDHEKTLRKIYIEKEITLDIKNVII